nr:FecR family protein [uncultured Dyadobacter sp.]
MMKYANHSVSDFLEDADFRKWVQNPATDSDTFWQQFLGEYPQQAATVAKAREVLLALDEEVNAGFGSRQHQDQVFRQIKTQIHTEQERPVRRLPAWPYWSAAASIALLLGLWFVNSPRRQALTYESNVAEARQRLVEKVNTGDVPMSVLLSDGSKIRLAPASRLSFPEQINEGDTREVYLSGEAYFDVARNPDRPFLVYSNELVTKVLGTSFNIRAYERDQDVVVNVTSGKVAVSISDELGVDRKTGNGKVRNLLLLPNQQARLSRKDVELVRSVVKEPVLVKGASLPKQFVFTRSPIPEVFETLEKAYGVPITFDADLFAQCELTADLTMESLYEKLDVICKSIEAEYRSTDGRIVISGRGCN